MIHYLLFVLFYLMILVILVQLGSFEYIPNQRNNPMLFYDNYAFNKCKPKPSDDGNISYRCVYYQTKGIKSHSSCTIKRLPNGEEIMIRAPKEHIGHGTYSDSTKCFKKAVAEIKVKCKEADQNYDKVKPNRIFNKVVESYMKNNNITLTNEVAKEMQQYKNYKKQLYQSIDKPKEAPKSTNDVTFDDSLYTETIDGRRFLLFDTNDEITFYGFIDTIKKFRSYNTVNYYNNEEIDYYCTEFFNYSQFIWPIKTTSDGNCLFHATSISINVFQ